MFVYNVFFVHLSDIIDAGDAPALHLKTPIYIPAYGAYPPGNEFLARALPRVPRLHPRHLRTLRWASYCFRTSSQYASEWWTRPRGFVKPEIDILSFPQSRTNPCHNFLSPTTQTTGRKFQAMPPWLEDNPFLISDSDLRTTFRFMPPSWAEPLSPTFESLCNRPQTPFIFVSGYPTTRYNYPRWRVHGWRRTLLPLDSNR